VTSREGQILLTFYARFRPIIFYQLETTGPPKTLSRELVDSETRTELKPQVQTVFTDKNPNATETKVVPPSHWANIDNNIAVVK